MTKENTIQPFQKGDVFVGCTLLNDPDDDHAGDGRIIQYDNQLNEKGVLWVEGTTHLVNGLKFGPDGTLWAFDQHNHTIIEIDPTGSQKPIRRFANRAFSHVNFGAAGLFFGEHLRGEVAPENMGTDLPKIPGTAKFGDGHIFRFDEGGELTNEYKTATHGGMAGFLAVTNSVLTPDERRIIYLSETGNRVFQYDIVEDRQLPDLAVFPEGREGFVFYLAYTPDGRLLLSRGRSIAVMDDQTGEISNEVPLEGFGWAAMCAANDNIHVFVANFFNGELAKLNLETGVPVANTKTNSERALAGVAEYGG